MEPLIRAYYLPPASLCSPLFLLLRAVEHATVLFFFSSALQPLLN